MGALVKRFWFSKNGMNTKARQWTHGPTWAPQLVMVWPVGSESGGNVWLGPRVWGNFFHPVGFFILNMPEFDGKFKNDGKMRKIINLPRTDPYLERFKKTL